MIDLEKYLAELVDPIYRKFNTRIVNTSLPIYGVRLPVLREVARTICREGDAGEFLASGKFDTYELSMIRGLVIANEAKRRNFAWITDQLAEFVPTIESWAVCDCFCGEFKTAAKHRAELLPLIEAMIATEREFEVRTGVILLMSYYLDDQYIDYSLSVLEKVGSCKTPYYVMMGVAWAVSVVFVKDRDRAAGLLAARTLDPVTQNKAIAKIRESFRVSEADKEIVCAWKLSK